MIPIDVINSILVLYYTFENFSLLFYSISFALDKDLRLISNYSPTPTKYIYIYIYVSINVKSVR